MGVPVHERRAALVDAALRVLSREGLAATSTRAIVEEAGMSLASLHYAFDSRDALLEAVVARVVRDEREAVHAVLASGAGAQRGDEASGATGDAVLQQLVRNGMERYVQTVVQYPGREHGMLELTLDASRHDDSRALVRSQYNSYRALVADLLVKAGQISGTRWRVPVDEIATVVVALTDGLTIAHIVDGVTPVLALDTVVAAILVHAETRPL